MLDQTQNASTTTTTKAAQSHEAPRHEGDFAKEVRAIGASAASVLSMLNEVTEAKRQSILELAQAASAGRRSASPGATHRPGAPLAEAIERAQNAAEQLGASGSRRPIDLLEHAVVQSIALAIQNTVAADQQLDILAQAVLTQAAVSLLGKDARATKTTDTVTSGA
jgi:hypothetical protein